MDALGADDASAPGAEVGPPAAALTGAGPGENAPAGAPLPTPDGGGDAAGGGSNGAALPPAPRPALNPREKSPGPAPAPPPAPRPPAPPPAPNPGGDVNALDRGVAPAPAPGEDTPPNPELKPDVDGILNPSTCAARSAPSADAGLPPPDAGRTGRGHECTRALSGTELHRLIGVRQATFRAAGSVTLSGSLLSRIGEAAVSAGASRLVALAQRLSCL